MLLINKSLRKLTTEVSVTLLVLSSSFAQAGLAHAAQRVVQCGPNVRANQCPQAPPPPPPARPLRSSTDIAGAAFGIGALVLIGAVIVAISGGESGKLKRNGPKFADDYPVGSFAIRGFAKDGWPVVIDYEALPGTVTTLDVVFDQKRTAKLLLHDGGDGARHLERLQMPSNGWAKKDARPASYIVRSVYAEGSEHAGLAAPIEVYGIGGGPRAVGSVAIEQLTFGEVSGDPAAPAKFGYHAKSPFNHVREEVVRFDDDGGTIKLTHVMELKQDDVAVGDHLGLWNGRDEHKKLSPGLHRFQVRGWFTSDDKSWVGAVAPTLLMLN